MVLTGAPGTGKTYLARQIALELTTEDKIEKVQFHPSFDYTDFVEGLRPVKNGEGISFKRKDGIFKKLCRRAKDDPNNKYVLIIDEINRGDISKIFGELFSSIEADYRYREYAITTQYSNLFEDRDEDEWDEPKFYVPDNLFILGTMNDIDRSVESMDFAIRRRFTWIEIKAGDNLSMLDGIEGETKCKLKMSAMNTAICNTPELGPAYEIGGAYFKKIDKLEGTDEERFNELWQYYLEPVIKEYLRGVLNTEAFNKIKDAYDQN
jgi:GTPase subunit of restriction endonuclease